MYKDGRWSMKRLNWLEERFEWESSKTVIIHCRPNVKVGFRCFGPMLYIGRSSSLPSRWAEGTLETLSIAYVWIIWQVDIDFNSRCWPPSRWFDFLAQVESAPPRRPQQMILIGVLTWKIWIFTDSEFLIYFLFCCLPSNTKNSNLIWWENGTQ